MNKTHKAVPIEQIEKEMDEGKEVLHKYFDTAHPVVRKRRIVHRVKKTNLDLTEEMANELDALAQSLNVSRQAVIKVILRQALDQRALAEKVIKTR